MYELALFTVFAIVHRGASVYLHEPSRVVFNHPKGVKDADFGFTMAYQAGDLRRLVIGAPRDTYIGNVFTCPIHGGRAGIASAKCEEVNIDFEHLTNSSRVGFPDQSYHLGASVAATADYFLTCAPLMTAEIIPPNDKASYQPEYDVTGACFVYKDTAYRLFDVFERYLHKDRVKTQYIRKRTFIGGTGWNSLVDEVNGLMLVMKSSLDADILHVPLKEPFKRVTSRTLGGLSWITGEDHYDWDINYLHARTDVGFGVTAGKFFSNETVYAFSLQTQTTSGEILFLEYNQKLNKLVTMTLSYKHPVKLTSDDVGSMFGSVLSSADINQDGYAELLVGAPTLSDDNYGLDVGAIHIYLGGSELIKDPDTQRTIVGVNEFARFGSAIATNDVDEDGIPEIFVSAPFEDDGVGAIYVFSGYVIKDFISHKEADVKQSVSQLKHQRIQVKDTRKFGYSLQVIPDKEHQGICSGLAVGAPASDSVFLYRCLPAIRVDLSAKLMGSEVVSTRASEFTMEVCANVRYPSKASIISTNLLLTSQVLTPGSDIKLSDALQTIDLSPNLETYCRKVTVDIKDSDSHQYLFEAQVELNKEMMENIKNDKVFKDTWLTLSEQSDPKAKVAVPRHCTGDECKPNLTLSLDWSINKDRRYTLGSSMNETVKLVVRNDGNNSYAACVIVTVRGAPAKVGCTSLGQGKYQCDMPKPLRLGKENPIDFVLDMSRPKNTDQKLVVEAELREICKIEGNYTRTLNVQYELNTDDVYLLGSSHENVITDSTVLSKSIKELTYRHEYEISNNGTINWSNVNAMITIENKPFITSISTNRDCFKDITENTTTYNCSIDVMRHQIQMITVTAIMSKDGLIKALKHGKLKTQSELILYMKPTLNEKRRNITTEFILKEELTIANNKNLILIIAIIVACVILAIVTYALYRMNFFTRNQKKRLECLRESVRRHSIKKSVSERARSSCVDGEPMINMDVLEDSPFDEIQLKVTTTDGKQIQEKAQVHH